MSSIPEALELDRRADTAEASPHDDDVEMLRIHEKTVLLLQSKLVVGGRLLDDIEPLVGLGFLLCRIARGAVLGEQLRVVVFQVEDAADAGEIDTGGDQFADSPQTSQIVGAIAAGPAVTANWSEQAVALVQP